MENCFLIVLFSKHSLKLEQFCFHTTVNTICFLFENNIFLIDNVNDTLGVRSWQSEQINLPTRIKLSKQWANSTKHANIAS